MVVSHPAAILAVRSGNLNRAASAVQFLIHQILHQILNSADVVLIRLWFWLWRWGPCILDSANCPFQLWKRDSRSHLSLTDGKDKSWHFGSRLPFTKGVVSLFIHNKFEVVWIWGKVILYKLYKASSPKCDVNWSETVHARGLDSWAFPSTGCPAFQAYAHRSTHCAQLQL